MILFTLFHVLISLVGIISGFVATWELVSDKPGGTWAGVFLSSTLATSITGFLFPFHRFLPSHAVGVLSLLALAIAIYARYPKALQGRWRGTYVVTAVLAFYFNFFVLIAQAFQKIPALHGAGQAPPPALFLGSELLALVVFTAAGVTAFRRFRRTPLAVA